MNLHLNEHPKELWILALSELCERFAFWGTADLLVLYLIEYYYYSHENATYVYGVLTGFSAFLPFIGGFLADRWNNYHTPLIVGAVANAIGCFLIALGYHSLLFIALLFSALGYGIFTPSLVTSLSFAYKKKASLKEAGFSIYYASINVGVFLALFSLGTIAKIYSWNLAFFIAGSVQVIGLIPLIFYLIKYKKTHQGLKEEKQLHSFSETKDPLEKRKLFILFTLCFASIFFWTAYNQAFSSMAIFAQDFMNKTVFHLSLPASVFMSSESFFLLLLAPLLALLYGKLQEKGKDPSAVTKTALGLLFITICFLVMSLASLPIPENATKANISWGYLVGAYFLMAVGEMLLAPVGLSAMTKLAPKKFQALSVGFWYLCIGVAFYLGGLLAELFEQLGTLFHFFSLFFFITLIPGLLLLFFSKKLRV